MTSVFLTGLMAYPLAAENFSGKKVPTVMLLIPMSLFAIVGSRNNNIR